MAERSVRVLAVADPAAFAYVEPRYGILDGWKAKGEHAASFDIIPWVDYLPLLERECAAAEPSYDIVMLAGHLWLRDYVERGILLPLGSRLAGLGSAYCDEDILPEIRRELEWKGERWLMPSFTDGHLLFIDSIAAATLFGDAIPAAVSTFEYHDMAERLATIRGCPSVILKAHHSEIFLDWLPYLLDEGLEPFDQDGLPLFNEPRGLHALERYLDMKRLALEASATAGNGEVLAAIRSRAAQAAVSWGGQAGRIADGDRNLRYIGLSHPWNVTWSFGLLARSSNADAAFRFLAYVTDRDVDKAVGRFAGSPTRASTYADPAERAMCPWYAVQEALVRRAYALPRFPGSSAAFGALYEALAAAFTGESTPGAALITAERKIREAVAR